MKSGLSDECENYFRNVRPRILSEHVRQVATLERAIGEALVDIIFALDRIDDGGRSALDPIKEMEFERCKHKGKLLQELASLADINFEEAAHLQGIAVLRERLGPDISCALLTEIVEAHYSILGNQRSHDAIKQPAEHKCKQSSLLH